MLYYKAFNLLEIDSVFDVKNKMPVKGQSIFYLLIRFISSQQYNFFPVAVDTKFIAIHAESRMCDSIVDC